MTALVEGREGSAVTRSEGDDVSLAESIVSIARSNSYVIMQLFFFFMSALFFLLFWFYSFLMSFLRRPSLCLFFRMV